MKYYLIAGEASGDLHGSNLIRHIRKLDQQAEVRAYGGDRMADAGATIVKHVSELAVMGFREVISKLRRVLGNLRLAKEDIRQFQPDVLVLIDYPGFNIRLAEWAKAQGLKVVYYISPQVWAWKESRVKKLKRYTDRLIVILPFEVEFFRKHGLEVDFVGHPLLEVMDEFHPQQDFRQQYGLGEGPVVALLPGSRRQEISSMLPVMLETSRSFKNVQFAIAGAPNVEDAFYQELMKGQQVPVIHNQTYDLLSVSKAAIVTSGTATLEVALLNVPEIVCYRTARFTYWLAKKLVKIRFISIVNIILDREVVHEFIQDDLNPELLRLELDALLENEQYRQEMLASFKELRQKLGGPGASGKAAKIVVEVGRS